MWKTVATLTVAKSKLWINPDLNLFLYIVGIVGSPKSQFFQRKF